MTAPTHTAFAIFIATCVDAPQGSAMACAFGSLFPDIDHPQSAIGRVLFFLSIPINDRFGHRGMVHGFILWVPFLTIAMFAGNATAHWIAIGGISHILIDCFNLSGVRALSPINQKPLVCFKREWRIRVGSLQEIFVFVGIIAAISLVHYSYSIGGPRRLINMLIHSPLITAEEYLRAGTKYCTAKGTFRWPDGRIESVEWPIVGTEGYRLVYWNGSRLINNDYDGEFLRSTLYQTNTEWNVIKVHGICTVTTESFWYDGQRWHHAVAGDSFLVRLRDNNLKAQRSQP
jgi:membrane-bound metal-dependent hydrolase YbcI (DUF457 family)